ncbi:MAG TPA: hypothetical protein VGB87_01130 [Vicinamibacteria bacterium]
MATARLRTSRRLSAGACVTLALFLLAAVAALRLALRERPTAHADSAEYLLTAESLFNHGTPNVHPADLLAFGRIASSFPLEGDYGRPLRQYLPAPDRRLYAIHFWAYPAVVLPAKVVLRLTGGNEFKAFQVTNVFFALGALAHVLFFSGLSGTARRLLAALLAASPFLPFLLWPHPEVVTAALATSSLVFRHDGRRGASVLAMALASLQAAPLALAAAALAVEGAWAARGLDGASRRGAVVRLGPAFALALLPTLFALVAFRHPSPLVLAGAYHPRHVSLFRALELLLDPNLGLLPYVPVTLALALGLTLARLWHGRTTDGRPSPAWLLAGLGLVALASSGAANWNHGTVGPSRYGLWLLPFVLVLLVEAVDSSTGRFRRLALALAVVAVLSQGAIALVRGGVYAQQDYARHSPAARLVLDRWPAAYNPTVETFVERTRHEEINPDLPLTHPVVYRSARGCRKGWVQKRHLPEVTASCGGAPTSGPDFRALKAHSGPDTWAYVSW